MGESNGGSRRGQAREFWLGHVEAQAASGLSVGEYCSRHGLGSASLYAWRRRLADGGCEAAGGIIRDKSAEFKGQLRIYIAKSCGTVS